MDLKKVQLWEKQHWTSDVAAVCMVNYICAGQGELASRVTNEELEEPQEIQCYKAETAIEP